MIGWGRVGLGRVEYLRVMCCGVALCLLCIRSFVSCSDTLKKAKNELMYWQTPTFIPTMFPFEAQMRSIFRIEL